MDQDRENSKSDNSNSKDHIPTSEIGKLSTDTIQGALKVNQPAVDIIQETTHDSGPILNKNTVQEVSDASPSDINVIQAISETIQQDVNVVQEKKDTSQMVRSFVQGTLDSKVPVENKQGTSEHKASEVGQTNMSTIQGTTNVINSNADDIQEPSNSDPPVVDTLEKTSDTSQTEVNTVQVPKGGLHINQSLAKAIQTNITCVARFSKARKRKIKQNKETNRDNAVSATFPFSRDWSRPFPKEVGRPEHKPASFTQKLDQASVNTHNSQILQQKDPPQNLQVSQSSSNPQPPMQESVANLQPAQKPNQVINIHEFDQSNPFPQRLDQLDSTHKRKLSESSPYQLPAKILKITEQAQQNMLAIAPVDYPVSVLTKNQMKLVQSAILAAIDSIASGEVYPRFVSCQKDKGTLVVNCFDIATFHWLKRVAETLKPWPDCDIKAVEPWKLHRVTKFVVWIPGAMRSPGNILHRLKQQNPGLKTLGWVVNQYIERNGGLSVVLSIKDNGVKALEAVNFEPFLNFTRVRFKKVEDSQDGTK